MRKSRGLLFDWLCLLFLLGVCDLKAQDMLPSCPFADKVQNECKPLHELHGAGDTVSVEVIFPKAFKQTGENVIVDSLALLDPVFEHLRLLRRGVSEDTLRIVHVGDSHVRGHIFPQTAGMRMIEAFGAVSYIDKGVNGATCLTFTHPRRLEEVVALRPSLLILSFGTNESHNRRYLANVHYHQMDELVKLFRERLPNVPILLTTPPGAYESFRQKRRRRTYVINPRTQTAVETMYRYARDNRLLLWDMYAVVGGKQRACQNWTEAQLMRPDHVHYLPEGYILQGNLLYQALIQAYNRYVSDGY